VRYWMRNRGQIVLRNTGAPRTVNVRLMAESFRVARRLEVWADEDRVLETLIYPEPLYVVVKGVRAPAGRSTLVLVVPEGADRVDRYLRSHDRREVSIAVSPPLVVDADDPEAAREVTAAFPRVERTVPALSPVENRAANLRREGRLTEAWEAYRIALEARPHPSTYVWAALTLTALDQLSAARDVLARGRTVAGLSASAIGARSVAGRLLEYLETSEVLAQRGRDPALEARRRGEIYRAVLIYREVLRADPDHLLANYWMGVLLAVAERGREAAPYLERVVRRRPEGPDARLIRDLQRFLPRG